MTQLPQSTVNTQISLSSARLSPHHPRLSVYMYRMCVSRVYRTYIWVSIACVCVVGSPILLCLRLQIVMGPQSPLSFSHLISLPYSIPHLSLSPFLPLAVCSSAPINMKVQHLNHTALVVRWTRPEFTYHPPIISFLISYSWTKHDESYEETHVTDSQHKLVSYSTPHPHTHTGTHTSTRT